MEEQREQMAAALLARVALGDQQAFKQLYELVSGKLNGIAHRIMQHPESANEVLQEAFVQIWHNAQQYRADAGNPMTWMASIVRYRAYDKLRAEKRRMETTHVKAELEDWEGLKGTADDPADTEAACQLGQQLQDCLATLEGTQQQAILMAYQYGFSRDDLALHFETPVNTVKSWLRRGLARLQQCLGT